MKNSNKHYVVVGTLTFVLACFPEVVSAQTPEAPSFISVLIKFFMMTMVLGVIPGALFGGGAMLVIQLLERRTAYASWVRSRFYAFVAVSSIAVASIAAITFSSLAETSLTNSPFVGFVVSVSVLAVILSALRHFDAISLGSLLGTTVVSTLPMAILLASQNMFQLLGLLPVLPAFSLLPAGYAFASNDRRIGFLIAGGAFCVPWFRNVELVVTQENLFMPALVEYPAIPVVLLIGMPILVLGGASGNVEHSQDGWHNP